MKLKLEQNYVDGLKAVVEDLWDAYPRLEMLPRWSSRWKVTAEDPRGFIDANVICKTELDDGETWVYVYQRDGEAWIELVKEVGL